MNIEPGTTINAAPAHVRFLLQAIDPTFRAADIDRAFGKALEFVSGDAPAASAHGDESKDYWIQEVAEAYMAECEVDGDELLAEDSLYRRFGGTIQNAFADPALALGFCLAYLLLRDKDAGRSRDADRVARSGMPVQIGGPR